jgi:sugar phosphate isomerase/epimerase
MNTPIALQLYSVREQLKDNFEETLARIVDMGYTAVESGEFAGDARKQAEAFEKFGLEVVAAHAKPPVGENREPTLDFMEALGCPRLVVPWLDPEVYYQSVTGVCQAIDLLNNAAVNAAQRGLPLYYHNHDFEFGTVDGRLIFDIMRAGLNENVLFEIDTYWVQTAGLDAVALVRDLGTRAPLLHIKDGPLDRQQPMVAVGDGKMEVDQIIAAGEPDTEWLVVELDRFAGDMLEAVSRSYDYLSVLASA